MKENSKTIPGNSYQIYIKSGPDTGTRCPEVNNFFVEPHLFGKEFQYVSICFFNKPPALTLVSVKFLKCISFSSVIFSMPDPEPQCQSIQIHWFWTRISLGQ
jgi:hypothetical protein